MEIIRELLTIGQRVRRTYAAPTRVTWSMKSAMNNRRLLADIFHDVDLATLGPARCIDVRTQQPKCRPDALAIRNPNSCFKPSIGLAEFILSEQPGRSVVATNFVRAGESLLYRIGDQRTILKVRVCCAARTGLECAVAATVAPRLKGPLGRLNR